MDSVSNNLAEAKLYASRGWRVIPCHHPVGSGCSCGRSDCKKPGKHPRLSRWQDKATTNMEQIESWWEQWPDANVGVALGPASGLFDIEFDDAEGEATAQELLADIETPTYRSHRSTHHLFIFPAGLVPPKAVLRWRGLEIRFGTDGRGAQSIFPPSLHASGERYQWQRHPASVSLADAPSWLADAIAEATAKPPKAESNGQADGVSLIMRGENESLENHPGESKGNRHSKLLELVGRRLGTHGPTGELPQLALEWAGRCSPPLDASEVLGVVRRLAEKELGKGTKQVGGGQLVMPSPTPRTFKARRYSDIDATDVEWLWHNRIALGKLTLLVGEPGLGKTFAAIDIAAHVSNGEAFADGAFPIMGEAAILTAEDGAGDTIRPRLDAAGADVSKVLHVDGVGSDDAKGFPSLKDDLAPLEQFFKSSPELRLIVIDPISAFMGERVDSHVNAQVRAVLGPLCELCERYRVALLGITHLAKSEAKAINRVIGSIAFVAAARAAWQISKDPDNEEGRLFLPVKNNLARCNGLAFAVVEGRCCWSSEEVLISADDIGNADETPREEAKSWLILKLHQPMPAKWMLAQAKADGISERTLHRAKKELGVTSERSADAWVWRLPDQSIEPAEEGVFLVQ